MYRALLDGNNRKVNDYLIKEYHYNPFDIESSQSMLVIALQFINRPELVDAIYEEIPSEDLIIENCLWCEYRIYVKSMADIQLKRYDTSIDLLTETLQKVDAFYLNRPLASAYIRSNRLIDLERLVSDLELTSESEDLMELYSFIGAEFLLINSKEMADQYLDKVIESDPPPTKDLLANSFYLKEDYNNALLLYQQLHDENQEDLTYISRLASCLYKNQKIEEGEQMIQKLEPLRADFQYGAVDYCIAEYYAVVQDEEKVFTYLLKSISQGNYYTLTSFQNDPHFAHYFKNKKFDEILNYWH
jgi:hypothetical protein